MKKKIISGFLFTGLFLLGCLTLSAVDKNEDADTYFLQGREKEKAGSYRKAASRYMDAHLLGKTSTYRGNALIAAARAYRKAKLYGDEFDCFTKLLREHLAEVDFDFIANRIYEIGDLYFAGHRDLAVDWIPFIKKDDRTFEIYEAALKIAPCMKPAAETRLRLARLYIDEQKPDDAIRHLRELAKLHPGTESSRYAMLELCSLLSQMSERGDGDHAYSKQAIEACSQFLSEYPNAKETVWVEKTRQEVYNRMAKRIYSVGRYYYKSGKPELAEKYLADVVRNYATTEIAQKSEQLLAKIDQEFEIPKGKRPAFFPIKENLIIQPAPKEEEPIVTTPEESDGRYLFPIRNLKKSYVVDATEADISLKKIPVEITKDKKK